MTNHHRETPILQKMNWKVSVTIVLEDFHECCKVSVV